MSTRQDEDAAATTPPRSPLAHVSWSGMLPSLDAKDADATLLKIFEAFFDAGACSRPVKLYGFPGDAPGVLPRG